MAAESITSSWQQVGTLRHPDGVRGIAFSPDGKLLATGCRDGVVRLWDPAELRQLGGSLRGHTGGVEGVAFSPDGGLLATSGRDGAVFLWVPHTGTVLGPLAGGHTDTVWGAAFSPDAHLLVTTGRDGRVCFWDLSPAPQVVAQHQLHTGALYGVAFRPDGSLLATVGRDMTVRLWDPATREPVGDPLVGHRDTVWGVAFSPDGRLLASASRDGTVRRWDPTTGLTVGAPFGAGPRPLLAVAFSPDGDLLVTAGDDGMVRGWDYAIGRESSPQLAAHRGPAVAVAFSTDGNVLASSSNDGTVQLWARTREAVDREPPAPPTAQSILERLPGVPRPGVGPTRLRGMGGVGKAFGGDQTGSMLVPDPVKAIADQSEQLEPVFRKDHSALRPVSEEEGRSGVPVDDPMRSVLAAASSPDGRVLAVASGFHLALLDPFTRRVIDLTLGHAGRIVAGVAVSGDGRWVAATSFDAVWLWDTANGAPGSISSWSGRGSAAPVALSPDGVRLAAAGFDGLIRIWNCSDGTPVGEPLEAHDGPVYALAFSPEGDVLASGGEDGTVRSWDPSAGAPLRDPLTGPEGDLRAVAYSPDGRLLAAAGWGGTIWLWDTTTWALLDVLEAEDAGTILGLAFRPDGSLLASAGRDARVQLWDPVSRLAVGGLPAGESGGGVVAFSPDGRLLVATDTEHTLHFWDVPELEISYVHTMAPDGASDVDRLGFDREATGLARVLAARATEPPLALALLGDWGSGKSTFMNRLESLVEGFRDEAEKLVVAAESLDASPYCPGIRQVRFNAWHYAEDRLWAGLIRRLLGQLASDPTVATAESARADEQRAELDEQIAKLDKDIGRVRTAGWARRVVRWLVRDEAVVEGLARGGQAAVGTVTTYNRRRLLALFGLAVVVAGAVAGLVLVAGDDTSWWRTAAGAVAVAGGISGAVAARLTRWARVVAAFVGPPTPKLAELKAQRANLRRQRETLDEELDPTRRLTRFLQDRQATLDYDPYRGLVSLVHDDLRTLAELIDGQAKAWKADPRPEAMPLERVILYIDDLDRCDPATVVDALRAIHLFLALRIFHVVVAVDARWLLRCLRHHYNTLLDDDTETASAPGGPGPAVQANGPAIPESSLEPNASTPIDYLEKIFQIAYEIPPMGDQVDDLVAHLMPLRPGSEGSEPDAEPELGADPDAGKASEVDPTTVDTEPSATGQRSESTSGPVAESARAGGQPVAESGPADGQPVPDGSPTAGVSPEPGGAAASGSGSTPADVYPPTVGESPSAPPSATRSPDVLPPPSSPLGPPAGDRVEVVASDRDLSSESAGTQHAPTTDPGARPDEVVAGPAAVTQPSANDDDPAGQSGAVDGSAAEGPSERASQAEQPGPSAGDAELAGEAAASTSGSISGLVARRTLDFTRAEVQAVRAAAALLDTPRTLKQLVNVYRVIRATAASAVLERLEDESAYVIVLLAVTYGHPLAAPDLFALVDGSPSGSNLTTVLRNPTASTSTVADRSAEVDAIPPVPPAHLAQVFARVLATLDSMGPAAPLDVDTYRYWLPRVARYSFRHRKLTTTAPTRRLPAPPSRRPGSDGTARPAG